MLNNGYWQGLKEYYETDYNGVAAGKKAEEYAQEMENGEASFLQYDRPFDPDEIKIWIDETEEGAANDYDWNVRDQNGQGNSELDELFPNLWNYSGYKDEIASYFMWKDLDRFKEEIKKENPEFVDEALRLEWQEMIEEIPTVKDMFLF